MKIIELNDIKKYYRMGRVEVSALKGVSLSIEEGDFIAVAGPSGSGKTTLMNIIGLIDTPTYGKVRIDGRDTHALNDKKMTDMRHKTLGFVFQSFNLIPVLNVVENVGLPLMLGNSPVPKSERKGWIDYLIEEVGLSEWRDHKPSELSGGQRQRVAIARALAGKPRIVIADEPTANLDSATGALILDLMKKINRHDRTTFIFSTHDAVISAMADHRIFLKDGLILSEERNPSKE
jgi:putative ABC transport system ATP-binding protein